MGLHVRKVPASRKWHFSFITRSGCDVVLAGLLDNTTFDYQFVIFTLQFVAYTINVEIDSL